MSRSVKRQTGFMLISLIMLSAACYQPKHSTQNSNISVQQDTNIAALRLLTDKIYSPTALEAAPDSSGRLFVCQLQGKIWIIRQDKVLPQPFLDISSKMVKPAGKGFDQRGLYDMAFHPQFAINKKFYVSYNAPARKPGDNCRLVVAEFHASPTDPNEADPNSEKKILTLDGRFLQQDGCHLSFGPDGYLYIGIGNIDTARHYNQAQQLNSWLGKILRIDVNNTYPYSIPADNPFAGKPGVKQEIWAYGLRRPWRFSFDPATHQLFVGEVGDKKQEEVDIIHKGGNYGWPVKEGDLLHDDSLHADTSRLIAPISTYTHREGLAVIGGYVYHGEAIPALQDKYIFGDYQGALFTLSRQTNGEWTRQPLRVSGKPADPMMIFSFGTDDKNELYLMGNISSAKGLKGAIYKIVNN